MVEVDTTPITRVAADVADRDALAANAPAEEPVPDPVPSLAVSTAHEPGLVAFSTEDEDPD